MQLLLSELVTNAVLHAQSAPDVAISLSRERVHVEVRDQDADVVRPRRASDDEESGRGLALVDALALAWGETHLPDGKVVWFDVAR